MNTITFDSVVATLGRIVADFGMKLLAAIAIWIIGFWLVKKIIASISYGMKMHNVEPSLASFTMSFLSITLKAFVLIIILTTIDVFC